MKLELAIGADPIPWRPNPETADQARRLVESVGPIDGILEVVLAGDDEVHRLNREYRGKDKTTDVLSFSYLEGHEGFREDLLYRRVQARRFSDEPGDGPLVVGLVMISVETMLKRDLRTDHSDEEEFVFLVIHGMLHTLGYDHTDVDGTLEMERKMEEILPDGATGAGPVHGDDSK